VTPQTLVGGGGAGKATRCPRVRPPHPTSAAFWLTYVLLLAVVLAVLTNH
jgi:hypothetical protein